MNYKAKLKQDMSREDGLRAAMFRRMDLRRNIKESLEEIELLRQQEDDIWSGMSTEMRFLWITEGRESDIRRNWTRNNHGWKATRSGVQRVKK